MTCFANGQLLKFQAGVSGSSLDWKIVNGTVQQYKQKITGHSIFIGLDYLQKKYFNLSSNIGILRKGGEEDNIFFTDPFGQPLIGEKQKATLDYLSINTTFDLKYPIKEKLFPFVSLGPRLDYLTSNNDRFNSLKEAKELNKFSYGINMGAGFQYQFLRFRIGIRGDYLLNLNHISDYTVTNMMRDERIQVKDKTFIGNLFLGVKLK